MRENKKSHNVINVSGAGMKIIFFGLGSIGKRHLRLLQATGKHEIFAFRTGLGAAADDVAGVRHLTTWDEVRAAKPEVAFITNPTFAHLSVAVRCASLGMALFVEKPLSDTMKDVLKLAVICRKKKQACYVAYPLRFHPVIRKAKELLMGNIELLHARVLCTSYLPTWRPGRQVKNVYSAKRWEGGGVILDASHEFDYLTYLLGPVRKISGAKGRASDVTVDAEDFADAQVLFNSGVVANVHLNCFSKRTEREFHIDLADGFLHGDLVANTLIVSRGGKEKIFRFLVKHDDYFKDQLAYFFAHLHKGKHMNDFDEAIPLLRKLLEFRNG